MKGGHMQTGYYKIAGVVIEICSIYEEIHKMSRKYRITGQNPEITIETTQENIEFERTVSEYLAKLEGEPNRMFTDASLETMAVHRKLATEMLQRDILLFHGSAVAVDGEVYLFTAKSGTGKSTHTRLWRQKFGNRAVMVNDDKPMLKVKASGISVCGTPWNGKHHLDTDTELPLKAICIIRQAEENHIEQISVREALPVLWQQSYKTPDEQDMGKMLELLSVIAEHVAIYKMGCNMEPEAADVAWEGMSRQAEEVVYG
jgi:serine kinase of HPr protein (carbohydrate metabolism regulator)